MTDHSTIGKMNEEYPLHLFLMKNVITEMNNDHTASGLYLLVFTLILELFRNTYLDLDLRKDLSKLALYLLIQFYIGLFDLPSDTGLQKSSPSKNKYVWIQ